MGRVRHVKDEALVRRTRDAREISGEVPSIGMHIDEPRQDGTEERPRVLRIWHGSM
jgi:hypothetical protein